MSEACARDERVSGECPSRARAPHTPAYGYPAPALVVNTRLPRRATRNGGRGATGAHRAFTARAAALLSVFVFAFAICPPIYAEAPNEVHGSGDAYAAPGVALAWAILRGADEASTQVVVRIVADVQRYPAIVAVARNPFSGQERVLRPATATTGAVDVRVPRAQYADFPRTDLRFFVSATPVQGEAPALMVFYLGVPDTAPEFATEANLDAYLTDRIARARAGTAKTP